AQGARKLGSTRGTKMSGKTFEDTLFVFRRNASSLHRARCAFFHTAIAGHSHAAASTVGSRPQFPSGSSAQRAIFKGHICVSSSASPKQSIRASAPGGKLWVLGKLW